MMTIKGILDLFLDTRNDNMQVLKNVWIGSYVPTSRLKQTGQLGDGPRIQGVFGAPRNPTLQAALAEPGLWVSD